MVVSSTGGNNVEEGGCTRNSKQQILIFFLVLGAAIYKSLQDPPPLSDFKLLKLNMLSADIAMGILKLAQNRPTLIKTVFIGPFKISIFQFIYG